MFALMPSVADLIVERLRAAGARALFGVPGGGSNLHLVEAAGAAGLPFVLTATETAAALAAAAQAEVTGECGACLTTLGPGATSVANGVAYAFLDRAPVLVFTDAHPAAAAGRYEHQRIDHAALMAPITKWRVTLDVTRAAETLDCAIATAVAPRPGPVHIDCPGDVAAADAPDAGRVLSDPPSDVERVSSDALHEFDRLLSRARKPLLLVGLGARRAADAVAIRRLCGQRIVPAMVTYKAKGVVPDDHPLFAGVFTNAQIERALIDESDLLIGVGLDPVELVPRPWSHAQPIVYCGRWPVEHGHVPFAADWIGDLPPILEQLGPMLSSAWDPEMVQRRLTAQREAVLVETGGLTAQQVVRTAARRLAGATRVTVDAGAHMFPVTMLWPVSEPNGMLISNGLSTMGFALPAAIGAALADRAHPVVVLSGDGGLLMCAGELLTAVRERLRIVAIVFNDASLSLIEIKQQAKRFRPSGVTLGGIDWRALAASLGAMAFPATTAGELERAIDSALACDGPSLIDVRIDNSNYAATLRAVRG